MKHLFLIALFILISVTFHPVNGQSDAGNKTTISVPFAVEEYARPDQSNNIRNYLMRIAGEVTQNSLAGINSLDNWENIRTQRHDQLIEMLGLVDVPMEGDRPLLNVKIIGAIKKEGK